VRTSRRLSCLILTITLLSLELLAEERPNLPSNLPSVKTDRTEKILERLSADSCFPGLDTLNIGEEKSADARACLEGLQWKPAKFTVRLQAAEKDKGDWLVRFPSATPVGNERNDMVALEWYQAKDAAGQPLSAPAVVIVHESGSNMMVGRAIAQMLRPRGVHTFLIHLPYYGVRRGPEGRPQGGNMIGILKQGIADTRRARDAVAALPYVDSSRIALQGTSLGGFVVATTAGLDNAYQRVFILLAGGDIYSVLMHGQRDAAKVRAEFQKSGLTDDELKELFATIEPLRLAHRINAKQTWMYTGSFDDVVPPRNAELFAKAAGLTEKHHIKMLANHYSGILFLPPLLQEIRDLILENPGE
jgi:dienelactone hydrolase